MLALVIIPVICERLKNELVTQSTNATALLQISSANNAWYLVVHKYAKILITLVLTDYDDGIINATKIYQYVHLFFFVQKANCPPKISFIGFVNVEKCIPYPTLNEIME